MMRFKRKGTTFSVSAVRTHCKRRLAFGFSGEGAVTGEDDGRGIAKFQGARGHVLGYGHAVDDGGMAVLAVLVPNSRKLT
jgi:hypothetical protein